MKDKFSVLEQIFGYKSFRGGQEPVIDAILSGQDTVGIMPTGAGESLCYQVPALLLEGVTIVVSPLISLMKDQVGSLVQAGVKAAYINSSLSAGQVEKVLENIGAGQYKLVYVAPERLLNERFLQALSNVQIALVAVDEAHCVSQWGQDFRPHYLDIRPFIERLGNRPVVAAFTATATDQVRRDIEEFLQFENPFRITTGFDRENLYFEVQRPARRTDAAVRFVVERSDKSGIIYCLSRKQVEELCDRLCAEGVSATRYHAGLGDEERRINQEKFQADTCSVMVATNAFGMGIDKSNVAYVLHCGMPKNIESYYQEAGRAGRDGMPAACVLFYADKDIMTNTLFIQGNSDLQAETDTALREALLVQDKIRLGNMVSYCKTTSCLRGYILSYFGEALEAERNCGNCFTCKHTFLERDITLEAQKILSCVKRMGERFGKQLLVETLEGKPAGKAVEFGLDRLSTYGILSDLKKKEIFELVNALVDAGYLFVTEQDVRRGIYPVVQLGAKARGVLFHGESVIIRVLEVPEEAPKKSRKGRKKEVLETLTDESASLFEALRALRLAFAKEQGVSAWIIFSDATLIEMTQTVPTTKAEFLDISGVGQTKLERYGEAFLELLRIHSREMGVPTE